MTETKSLMILIAAPYRSGTNDDPEKMKANVDSMTDVALRLYRAGHMPIVGEWLALPLVERAGSQRKFFIQLPIGWRFAAMPVSALAVLRMERTKW